MCCVVGVGGSNPTFPCGLDTVVYGGSRSRVFLWRGSDPNFPDVYLDVAHDMHVVGASVHLSVRHDVYACINIHWDILYMMS